MTHAVKFNPDDGSVHVDGVSLVIKNGLLAESARQALTQFHQSEIDHQNGFVWQRYHGFKLNDESAGLSLCFHCGKLAAVHLGVTLPNMKLEDGWSTKESIGREVEFLRKALGDQLCRSFDNGQEEFSWGTAWALFDAKGFLASAGARYKK